MFARLLIVLSVALLARQAWSEVKNSRKGALKEQYLSKSHGEMQFNKYKGQLPGKGGVLECSIQCFSMPTCHCVSVNVNTNQCSFHQPQAKITLNKTQLNDFMFFTRDTYVWNGDSFDKHNLAEKAKVSTSHTMAKLTSKAKGSKQAEPALNISKPWVQFEFKETMYITELQLAAIPSIQLKHFQIRVGDAKLVPEQTHNSSETSEEGNSLCFEYNEKKHFFAPSTTRRNALTRTVKCEPCGQVGRYLFIQAFEPCEDCLKNDDINSGAYPLPMASVDIFGYPLKQ